MSSEKFRIFVLPLIFLAASLLIQFALGLPFTLGLVARDLALHERVLITVAVFVASITYTVYLKVDQAVVAREEEQRTARLRFKGDADLEDIRIAMYGLIQNQYSERDLFVAYFRNELSNLRKTIGVASQRRELTVQSDHFLSVPNVLDAFGRDTSRIWRVTWPMQVTEHIFVPTEWKVYFEATAQMAEDGKINEIRALLILEDKNDLTDRRLDALLDFYAQRKNMCARWVLRQDYESLADGNGIAGALDFGIYGETLMFLTEEESPKIRGTFTRDPERMARYISFFDQVWGSDVVSHLEKRPGATNLSVADLLKLDERFASSVAEAG